MALIIYDKEYKVMVDYSDLRKAYIEYDNAKTKYWSDLEKKIISIYCSFAEYLNILGKTYSDNSGQELHYLKLGAYKDNQFFEKNMDFPKNAQKLSMSFALSITLDKGEEFFPKFNLILLLEIAKRNGKFVYEIIKNGKVNKIEDENEVLKQLVDDIFESINPKVF